jgi:hypothetical protein
MIRQTLAEWRYRVHEIILDRELGAFEDRKRLCVTLRIYLVVNYDQYTFFLSTTISYWQ